MEETSQLNYGASGVVEAACTIAGIAPPGGEYRQVESEFIEKSP